ncbi:MAG: hypothetical protein ACPLW6_00755 [Desulfurella sp.]|jgi:hypothetical protein|uniref:Uncharacterized protein n=1 Tax=Desulfurella multipotens TaxID=79269 RepID=A0A1G6I2X0_9BACT|nr:MULTISPECIES: hypothetical protein [Desulfurella]AHF98145.1 hypothetical protein DESACE_07860 [Desulfurella acetivorans A63]PMP68322.1 MAG: hypothetical protein C0192_02150 [Desulfurella multipotens]PMP89726.1 MAG: hypothetical protein C0173_05290 [Desulfurella sp.]SDC00723.1 hypothetical protein SAMN05660835_00197 [Desulfurella multipotens]
MKKLVVFLGLCLVLVSKAFANDLSLVKNSTIQSGACDLTVHLKNGEFKSDLQRCYISVYDVVFGNLNNKRVAVLVSGEGGGGSGCFSYVRVMEKVGGKYKQISNNIDLGDRIDYKKAYIKGNILYVDYYEHGPNDCMACKPTLHKILKLKLINNKLVKI